MGRNLPWTRKTDSTTVQTRAPTAAAAASFNKLDVPPAEDQRKPDARPPQDKWRSTPHTPRKRAHTRTPSTSPPPGPPSFSVMQPGYTKDDIYIMVEDEFYSVAQSYTAHLHHAEYKRLMRKAREAPPREIADLSPGKPRDARDRAKREQLKERQRSALDDMLGQGPQQAIANDDDSNSNQEQDEPKANGGRWRNGNGGLAGLMRDGSQTKTSLVGLERVPTSTRAAMGYNKSNASADNARSTTTNTTSTSNRPVNSSKDDVIDDIFRMKPRKAGQTRQDNDNDNDDDAFSRTYRKSKEAQRVRIRDGHDERIFQRGNAMDSSARTRTTTMTTKPKRSFIDDLEDELDRDQNREIAGRPTAPPFTKVKVDRRFGDSKSESEAKTDQNKKDRNSRLDDVPMFMF